MTDKELYTVDSTHTDPTQIKTALALAVKQLARVEKRMKVMYDALIEIGKFSTHYCQDCSSYDCSCYESIAHEATKPTADKFMEDILMPDKGGDK